MHLAPTRTVLAGLLVALATGAGPTPGEANPGKKGGQRGKDTTPPTITCPSDITIDALWSWGGFPQFTVTATDDKDPSPYVDASPRAGTAFPVGTTTVTATATDWKGNTSSCTFDVTVRPFTQTVLPPEGVRTYKAYWRTEELDDSVPYFEWDVTVAADGTVSGTGRQTGLVTTDDVYLTIWHAGDLPSGLSGEGVVSGTIAPDGAGQFTSSATYWVWLAGDYDADGNKVYTQRTAGFSGLATANWDSSANITFWPSPDPLASPLVFGFDGFWYVQ